MKFKQPRQESWMRFKQHRNRLGAPPPPEEASGNLDAPETAPDPEALPPPPVKQSEPAPRRVAPLRASAASTPPPPVPRIDGRTIRRTQRTVQFATRVTPEFDNRVRTLAIEQGLMLVEVLELALEAYEATLEQEEGVVHSGAGKRKKALPRRAPASPAEDLLSS